MFLALRRSGASGRRVDAFANCGNTLWLAADGRTPVLLCNRCHDRLCKVCQKERQAAVVEGITLRMLDVPTRLRFLTLTLKHGPAPLEAQIDRLLAAFKLLRNRREVSEEMRGGAWFLEVKLDRNGSLWHPHLHVVMEGDRIDQKLLAKLWFECTGDSYIVDIRVINEPSKRARYVAKYATKPLHNAVSGWPEKLLEFVKAIKGRRLYQCFGTWSRAVKRDKPGARKLEMVGTIESIWAAACAGEIQSLVWLHQAHDRWPALRKSFPLPDALVFTEPDPP